MLYGTLDRVHEKISYIVDHCCIKYLQDNVLIQIIKILANQGHLFGCCDDSLNAFGLRCTFMSNISGR